MSRLILTAYNSGEVLAQIEIALRTAGYRVMAASSPIAAVDFLDRERPAALLTGVDFGKGKPNGIALARMARSSRVRLPVLFLCTTVWDDLISETGGEMLKLPLDPAELVAKVRRMTGGMHPHPPEAA